MVGFYIKMRLRQFWRFFSFNEINPVVGIILLAALFIILSEILFIKLPYAGAVYAVLAFVLLVQSQRPEGNAFLKQKTNKSVFFRSKLAEHLLILLPFVIELCYHGFYLYTLALLAVVVPYSFFSFHIPRPALKALKTPYPAYAYEYLNGFRMFWLVYPLHIVLLVAGILSGNVYVLVVAYIFLLFFISAFYGVMEGPIYIWLYRMGASKFLFLKLRTLARNYVVSFLPFLTVSGMFFTADITLVILCLATGGLALIGGMLIKYHFYPSEFVVQISQVIFLGLSMACLVSPPLILLVICFLVFSFFKARQRLRSILQC